MSVRYDRQLRLWGEDGQRALESASICTMGSDVLATEVLKNLVLAGVGKITIFDSALVTEPDLGNNFFVTRDNLGSHRADVVAKYLRELNPSVSVESWLGEPLVEMRKQDLDRLATFTLVLGCNLMPKMASSVAAFLHQRFVPFAYVRQVGLTCLIQLSVKEHLVLDAHEEHPAPDVRLDAPWPELLDHFESWRARWDGLTDEQQKHTPYLILYYLALGKWREGRADGATAFPTTYAERKELLKLVSELKRDHIVDAANFDEARQNAIKCLRSTEIPANTQQVLARSLSSAKLSASEWLILRGAARWVEENGRLPVTGTLPDMTASSESYTTLLGLYRSRAASDASGVFQLALREAHALGSSPSSPPPSITPELCHRLSTKLAHMHFLTSDAPSVVDWSAPKLEDALRQQLLDVASQIDVDEQRLTSDAWLIGLAATDRFHASKCRYPGTNGVAMDVDVGDLRTVASHFLDELQVEAERRDKLLQVLHPVLYEFCRTGAAAPHAPAAIAGAVAAHELVKLATRQFLPVNNTLLLDMHAYETATYRLGAVV